MFKMFKERSVTGKAAFFRAQKEFRTHPLQDRMSFRLDGGFFFSLEFIPFM
jgi:hypothetical protein